MPVEYTLNETLRCSAYSNCRMQSLQGQVVVAFERKCGLEAGTRIIFPVEADQDRQSYCSRRRGRYL